MRRIHLPGRSGTRSQAGPRLRRGRRRTRREWAEDLGLFLFAACFALASASSVPVAEGRGPLVEVADQLAGGLGCAAVFLRRRWPVPLAVVLLVGGKFGHYLAGPAMVALYTVAATRSGRTTGWIAALAFAPVPYFLIFQVPEVERDRISSAATYFALMAGSIGWGLFQRSRRLLVDSLRERAERAEEGAALRAESARRQAREEIAREMHDVLAHRLSLLSVHAGALEYHRSAGPDEVARAAGVIRDSAHRALQELREIIGVLRAPVDDARPQPTVREVDTLVEELREVGTEIAYTPLPPEAVGRVPAALGRTAYRIVQEGLTNARKHAPDTPVRVTLSARPGEELRVELRNARPARSDERPADRHSEQQPDRRSDRPADRAADPPADRASDQASDRVADRVAGRVPGARAIPGAGQGLIGLAERAALAGGRLEHGPHGADFRLMAWLPWSADRTAADG